MIIYFSMPLFFFADSGIRSLAAVFDCVYKASLAPNDFGLLSDRIGNRVFSCGPTVGGSLRIVIVREFCQVEYQIQNKTEPPSLP